MILSIRSSLRNRLLAILLIPALLVDPAWASVRSSAPMFSATSSFFNTQAIAASRWGYTQSDFFPRLARHMVVAAAVLCIPAISVFAQPLPSIRTSTRSQWYAGDRPVTLSQPSAGYLQIRIVPFDLKHVHAVRVLLDVQGKEPKLSFGMYAIRQAQGGGWDVSAPEMLHKEVPFQEIDQKTDKRIMLWIPQKVLPSPQITRVAVQVEYESDLHEAKPQDTVEVQSVAHPSLQAMHFNGFSTAGFSFNLPWPVVFIVSLLVLLIWKVRKNNTSRSRFKSSKRNFLRAIGGGVVAGQALLQGDPQQAQVQIYSDADALAAGIQTARSVIALLTNSFYASSPITRHVIQFLGRVNQTELFQITRDIRLIAILEDPPSQKVSVNPRNFLRLTGPDRQATIAHEGAHHEWLHTLREFFVSAWNQLWAVASSQDIVTSRELQRHYRQMWAMHARNEFEAYQFQIWIYALQAKAAGYTDLRQYLNDLAAQSADNARATNLRGFITLLTGWNLNDLAAIGLNEKTFSARLFLNELVPMQGQAGQQIAATIAASEGVDLSSLDRIMEWAAGWLTDPAWYNPPAPANSLANDALLQRMQTELVRLLGLPPGSALPTLANLSTAGYWQTRGLTAAQATVTAQTMGQYSRLVETRLGAISFPTEIASSRLQLGLLQMHLTMEGTLNAIRRAPTPRERMIVVVEQVLQSTFREAFNIELVMSQARLSSPLRADWPAPANLFLLPQIISACVLVGETELEALRAIGGVAVALATTWGPLQRGVNGVPAPTPSFSEAFFELLNQVLLPYDHVLEAEAESRPAKTIRVTADLYRLDRSRDETYDVAGTPVIVSPGRHRWGVRDPQPFGGVAGFGIRGVDNHVVLNEDIATTTVPVLQQVRSAADGLLSPSPAFSFWDPIIKVIIDRSFPSVSGIFAALREEYVQHELLHKLFVNAKFYNPARRIAKIFAASAPELAEQQTHEFAAYTGTMAFSDRPLWHAFQWVTMLRLPNAANLANSPMAVLGENLLREWVARLARLTGRPITDFLPNAPLTRLDGIALLKQLVLLPNAVLVQAARLSYEEEIGPLPAERFKRLPPNRRLAERQSPVLLERAAEASIHRSLPKPYIAAFFLGLISLYLPHSVHAQTSQSVVKDPRAQNLTISYSIYKEIKTARTLDEKREALRVALANWPILPTLFEYSNESMIDVLNMMGEPLLYENANSLIHDAITNSKNKTFIFNDPKMFTIVDVFLRAYAVHPSESPAKDTLVAYFLALPLSHDPKITALLTLINREDPRPATKEAAARFLEAQRLRQEIAEKIENVPQVTADLANPLKNRKGRAVVAGMALDHQTETAKIQVVSDLNRVLQSSHGDDLIELAYQAKNSDSAITRFEANRNLEHSLREGIEDSEAREIVVKHFLDLAEADIPSHMASDRIYSDAYITLSDRNLSEAMKAAISDEATTRLLNLDRTFDLYLKKDQDKWILSDETSAQDKRYSLYVDLLREIHPEILAAYEKSPEALAISEDLASRLRQKVIVIGSTAVALGFFLALLMIPKHKWREWFTLGILGWSVFYAQSPFPYSPKAGHSRVYWAA